MDLPDVFATILALATSTKQAELLAPLAEEGGTSLASTRQLDNHLIVHGPAEALDSYLSRTRLGEPQDYILKALVQRALSPWSNEPDLRVEILEAVFGSHSNLDQHSLERLLTEVNGPGDTPTVFTEAVRRGLKRHLTSHGLADKVVKALVNASRQSNGTKLLRTILVVLQPVLTPVLTWVLVDIPLSEVEQEGVYNVLKEYLRSEAIDFGEVGVVRSDSIAWYIACQIQARYTDSVYRVWLAKLLATTESADYVRAILNKVQNADWRELVSSVHDCYDLTLIRSFSDIRG